MAGRKKIDEGTMMAPPGCLWVCLACGKTSGTRYGFDAGNRSVSMPGWDESCMMSCSLFRREDIAAQSEGGRVIAFKPGTKEIVPERAPGPARVSDGNSR